MKLNDLFEDASAGSVAAHSVAGARGSLFTAGPITPASIKRKMPQLGHVMKLDLNKRKKVAGIEVIKYSSGE